MPFLLYRGSREPRIRDKKPHPVRTLTQLKADGPATVLSWSNSALHFGHSSFLTFPAF